MKKSMFVLLLLTGIAVAQDKPRVFVQGKGSEDVQSSGSGGGGRHWGAWGSRSTIDSHDEGMEVTKDLQKNCTGVTVTLNQSAADYTVMLNRESKKNRGLLRTNSQVQVANRLGDVLGTSATRTVGNAAKDACELILADWSQHGPLTSPNANPAPAAATPAPAVPATALKTVSSSQSQDAEQDAPAPAPADNGSASLGNAAKKQQQLKACQALAKDNPSIVCK
ncbi:MAG TPA: hypothetical protein VFA67_18445 [Candidatus Sulfotelmatobacter sp.]|nr:hypothetical protein [Candidatus Sulfotelmatobacter sp.]